MPQTCSYCTGGARTYTNVDGATIWFAFQGNRVTYEFSQHPSRGNVEFYLDKNLVLTRNIYSANPIWGSMITFDVPNGNHILEVRKADVGSSTYMDFDAFHVDIGRAEVPGNPGASLNFDDSKNAYYLRKHNSPSFTDWQVSTNATGAWEDTTTYSSMTDASVSFTFSGSAVEYLFTKRNDRGIARVTIDGVRKQDVDHYGPYPNQQYPNGQRLQQSPRWNLTPGTHTIVISVSGTRNQASGGNVVDIDAFTVYK
jgi:hypothetical protein